MKVLLIPNFEGWAFDHIAQGIKKFGTNTYDIIYEKDYRQYRGKDAPIEFGKYDRIIMFAPWMRWANMPLDRTICICHEQFEFNGYDTSIYRKVFLTSDISMKLANQKKNIVKVQAGIDTSKFFPVEGKKSDFTVGWVGAYSGHVEKKGYEEFYKPLGNWFNLLPHTKEDDYIEGDYYEAMRKYYASINVLVCTSSFEGYPLTILEATACGVPVVSTKVGIAPEILPDHQIVPRVVGEFKRRLEGQYFIVPDISDWKWENKIKEWEDELL